jgi:hypothetical protein
VKDRAASCDRHSPLCLVFALALVGLFSLGACSEQGVLTPKLDYELTQQAYRPELVSSLTLQVQDDSLHFAIIFQGGGGENEKARLEVVDGVLRLVLINADHKSEKMQVNYYLEGSVSGLGPGEYRLQIVDSSDRLIAEDTFTIR